MSRPPPAIRFVDIYFLQFEQVHALHDDALADAGGLDGVRDLGMIFSAVAAPQNSYDCVTLADIAAIYAHALAKNHGYVDGNKRTGVSAAVAFLEMNGFPVQLDPSKWSTIMEGVAEDLVSREQLAIEFKTEMGSDPVIEY